MKRLDETRPKTPGDPSYIESAGGSFPQIAEYETVAGTKYKTGHLEIGLEEKKKE